VTTALHPTVSLAIPRYRWAGVLIVSLATLAIGLYANRFGADVIPDSAEYISGAIRVAHGAGYSQPNRSGPPIPLTWFPPLFPALIAGFESLDLPLYKAVGVFNAFCYAALVAAAGVWVWRATASGFWSTLAALIVLTSHAIYWINAFVLSEPLFLLWMLGYLWCLINWRKTGKLRWPVWAGICIGCGMLTRYAGLCLLPAGAIVILLTPRAPSTDAAPIRWREKLAAVALLSVVGLAPSFIWSKYHTPSDLSATGRTVRWHPITPQILQNGIEVLSSFIVPREYALHLPSAVLVAIAFALLLGSWIWLSRRMATAGSIAPPPTTQLAARCSAAIQVCLIFVLSYVAFLILSICFVDGTLDERFFSIMVMPLVVLCCIGGQAISAALRSGKLRTGLGIVLLAILATHAANLAGEFRQRQSADDLAWYPTLQSDTLDALRDIPAEVNVWSGKSYGIFMAYRIRTDELPYQPADSADEEKAYAEGIQSLRHELNDAGGGWIVFWNQLDDFGDCLLTEDDVRQNFVVAQENKYADGVLMRIDHPLDKPDTDSEN
jgi:hypothetical protein